MSNENPQPTHGRGSIVRVAPPREVPALRPRPRNAHKGTMGRLLVIGGSTGLTGAVALACEAALRSGVGLVTAAVPASLNPILEVKLTEAMTLPVGESSVPGVFGEAAADELEPAIDRADAVIVGPGLGRAAPAARFFGSLLPRLTRPHAIDADGLWHLATLIREAGSPPELSATADAGRLATLRGAVLTPHAGEARLLFAAAGLDPEPAATAARSFVARFGGTWALKGAPTLVLDAAREYCNASGNPGMATGGTGDVLAGIIGAFLARGDAPWEATVRATWLHGRAGDLAAAEVGEESLIASDVVRFLPHAFREFEQARS
ncbi:MAG: NAD(P)H-hydrate dehydratase [Planctomycetota bacterium]